MKTIVLAGPVRQIVFAYPGIDGARPFVFDIPSAPANRTGFTFKLPDALPVRPLDERLALRDATLVAPGEGRELIYQRIPAKDAD